MRILRIAKAFQIGVNTTALQTRTAACTATRRYISATVPASKALETDADLDDFLSKPTWSIEALLPTDQQIEETSEVTPKQLHHLLRLSALPAPSTVEEQAKMLQDLKSQLHFVKEIQRVDTAGVEPLQSIRDETAVAEIESQVDFASLEEALGQEAEVGTHHKRIRRKRDDAPVAKGVEDWNVLGQASQKVGRYFVVHGQGEN